MFRIEELSNALDSRSSGAVSVEKIKGTGTTFKKTFWISVADK